MIILILLKRLKVVKEMLIRCRDHIQYDDYIATCGCNCRPKDTEELMRKNCSCYREHIEFVEEITALIETLK